MDRPSVSDVTGFDLTKLKRTKTVIKNKLPTQEDIEAERN